MPDPSAPPKHRIYLIGVSWPGDDGWDPPVADPQHGYFVDAHRVAIACRALDKAARQRQARFYTEASDSHRKRGRIAGLAAPMPFEPDNYRCVWAAERHTPIEVNPSE